MWSTILGYPQSFHSFRVVDNLSKGSSIAMPKPSSKEFRDASSAIGSFSASNTVRLKRDQLVTLVQTHTAFMGVVEEVRARIMNTKGVLGPHQYASLALLTYPYVSNDGLFQVPDFDVVASVERNKAAKSRMNGLSTTELNKYLKLVGEGRAHFNALKESSG